MIYASCGFLFDDNGGRVALIEKKSGPAHLIGTLNGIGGKMWPMETSVECQKREFLEETGVRVEGWRMFCKLIAGNWEVHFFFAKYTKALNKVRTMENEPVSVHEVAKCLLSSSIVAPNLRWLLPMALSKVMLSASVQEHGR